MKKYDLLTPEGTRDLLFDECIVKRDIERKLTELYEKRGYSEIITTGLEFFDVFNQKTQYFSQEQLYKLVDNKNRLLVMRPDSTMPIARVVATRLRESIFPLKLFYTQNVFLVNPKNSGREDEIAQSGVEIIGGDEQKADLEALSLAVEAMKAVIGEDFRFEIGSSVFYKGLIAQLSMSEEKVEEIRSCVETKNFPALERLLSTYADNEVTRAIKALPSLFGGAEVFGKASELMPFDFAEEAIASLKNVYTVLDSLGLSDRITVDLGLVNRINYYTGLLFKAYVEDYGQPVLSGGRYDTLISDFGFNVPATGFALNLDPLRTIAMKKAHIKNKTPEILVFAEKDNMVEGIIHCNKLNRDGIFAENSVEVDFESALVYARKRKIEKIHKVTNGSVTEIMTREEDNG